MKRVLLFIISALLAVHTVTAQTSLSVDAMRVPIDSESNVMALRLTNKDNVKGFQCDITLPAWLSFDQAAPLLSPRSSGHDIALRRISDSSIRLIVTSGTESLFSEGNDTVITVGVNVAADTPVGMYNITLSNQYIVFDTYHMIQPQASTWAISVSLTGDDDSILPGTLEDVLNDEGLTDEEYLKLRGALNGTDIRFIRSLSRLRRLDISECRIVEGGTSYVSELYTADDVVGDSMFYAMPRLNEIWLPAGSDSVGNDVFHESSSLLAVHWCSTVPVVSETFGTHAANLLVYVPEGTEYRFDGNIIIGGVAPRITLSDGQPFRCPEAFTAREATFSRYFDKPTVIGEPAGWETIVLPFDVQTVTTADGRSLAPFGSQAVADKTARPFWLDSYGTDGFTAATTMTAGTPYIIAMPNNTAYNDEYNVTDTVTFAATDVTISATTDDGTEGTVAGGASFAMVPAWSAVAAADTVFAINDETYEAEGVSHHAGSLFVKAGRDVRPFEAYLRPLTAEARGHRYVAIGGVTTGIDEILHADAARDGLRVWSSGGLLYIESASSQSVNIFSADGRLVRRLHLQEGVTSVAGLAPGVYIAGRRKVVVH